MTTKAGWKDVTKQLVAGYRQDGAVNLGDPDIPARSEVVEVLGLVEELFFPGFARDEHLCDANLEAVTAKRVAHLASRIEELTDAETADALLDALPPIRAKLLLDVAALHDGDPAVKSREEVILAYPGLRAVMVHRVAHWFYTHGKTLIARMMGEHVHGQTGIDIHPGARIGDHFYIDHGTGVVIGETTVIGDHVKIYQGVSLGALSVSRRLASTKRHPTIEDHVTIYAGATILGGDTVVGHHSVVGGNVWLVKSVPAYSIVENDPSIKIGNKQDRLEKERA